MPLPSATRRNRLVALQPAYRSTDIPLTGQGERDARKMSERLRTMKLSRVFTSPLQRARRIELARLGEVAEVETNLIEWDYGDNEGQRPAGYSQGTARPERLLRRMPRGRIARPGFRTRRSGDWSAPRVGSDYNQGRRSIPS